MKFFCLQKDFIKKNSSNFGRKPLRKIFDNHRQFQYDTLKENNNINTGIFWFLVLKEIPKKELFSCHITLNFFLNMRIEN